MKGQEMKQDYIITVVSHQQVDGQEDNFEITTHAELTVAEKGYTVSYTEEDEQGFRSTTHMYMENGILTVIRQSNDMTTHIILEKGIRHVSHHETVYGTFSMGINTLEMKSDINEDGGRLYFKYATDIDLSPLGEMEFDVTLKKKVKG